MRKLLSTGLLLLLAGCSSSHRDNPHQLIDRGEYKVDTSTPSIAQNERVRFLVLHYTATDDAESLRLLTQGDVSAHYLVKTHPESLNGKPVVLQLVPESQRAWHAGVSYWQGRNSLNDTSIGIEIVNRGFTERMLRREWYPYNESQIELIERLTKDIVERYNIEPANVVAHSDIAPLRKSDPGPLFPWKRLATQGIGAWPDDATVTKYIAERNKHDMASVSIIQQTLARYGYQIPQNGELDDETRQVIKAFQMHFRAQDFSGIPDVETEAIALALVEKYRPLHP
ncbi:N-acetylmuramoyl-L-alanine amidase [Yersinia enterocolitica]|uniref:N-acetylmuramoyl-L-alanine amidase n=1 Tax=Yersinia enterocolitica TaxID=630 RepID=UPI0002819844|nr:N-acetylmuramoyl-L-alanine amidase [Yersinia enterocolitica]AJI84209.1 N-acetylmuramoyl-L-alanine amidase family protein [Yersinia enterocolitica]EKA27691.1 N-acetylmuramoyl-L-alanine amidase [Yersinia enterocolitica subsp. enterocolitica WA-314]ELI8283692.1 N-acetylmuramoyl-L-alanine amidase [Yersinia enterocolitica]KGA70886.1 N-acetylmuramoyl-L-alanine amidase family protein [Yersinia enterocolitica]KGA77149.1 N-acetylmuramoyl-L-alanine amidase family protein [Yersinia enterocolitica]